MCTYVGQDIDGEKRKKNKREDRLRERKDGEEMRRIWGVNRRSRRKKCRREKWKEEGE
jgi:hypothetical protein